jgi:hypothetical protein
MQRHYRGTNVTLINNMLTILNCYSISLAHGCRFGLGLGLGQGSAHL